MQNLGRDRCGHCAGFFFQILFGGFCLFRNLFAHGGNLRSGFSLHLRDRFPPRTLRLAALFFHVAAHFSIYVFLSLYLVNVLGVSATAAGSTLIPLMGGMVISSIVSSQIVQRMGAAFRESRFEDGLTQALEEVSAMLVQHFPAAEGERLHNQLPDTPVLR